MRLLIRADRSEMSGRRSDGDVSAVVALRPNYGHVIAANYEVETTRYPPSVSFAAKWRSFN